MYQTLGLGRYILIEEKYLRNRKSEDHPVNLSIQNLVIIVSELLKAHNYISSTKAQTPYEKRI